MIKQCIAILVPVFNEEKNIQRFIFEVSKVINKEYDQFSFSIIFSDNASTDGTLNAIRSTKCDNINIQYISLSKNFGYQCSLLALLHNSVADYYIIIDVDFEDPPEIIPLFLAELQNGYDYVYGVRRGRSENFLITLCRKLFYRMTKLVADADFLVDVAEFSIFSHQIKKCILNTQNSFPFIRVDLANAGFKRKGIKYNRAPRSNGISNYNIPRLINFAIAGFLSSTTFPLRLVFFCGLLLIPFIFIKIYLPQTSASLILDLFIAYFIFSNIAISIYLARTYKNTLKKPLFIVKSKSENMTLLKEFA